MTDIPEEYNNLKLGQYKQPRAKIHSVINPLQCENKRDPRNLSLKNGNHNKGGMGIFPTDSRSPKNDGVRGTSLAGQENSRATVLP